MESLGLIQYDSSIPLAGLNYVGDLHWIQKKVLQFRQTDNRYNQSVMSEFEISDLLKAYNARDCTIQQIVYRQNDSKIVFTS